MKKRFLLLPALALALTACGGPAGESAPPKPPEESFSLVYTDWSRLEPYRPDRGLYTRYYDRPTDRLLPVEGGYGGALIPFLGSRQESTEGWGNVMKYGLATADGMVVCDPVYSSVSTRNGYLILNRTNLVSEDGWDTQDQVAVAAADGSWVLPSKYQGMWPMPDGRLLLMDTAGALWFCGPNGALTPSPLTEALRAYPEITLAQAVSWTHFQDGLAIYHNVSEGRIESGGWLLNAVTGEVRSLPQAIRCWGWSSGEPLTAASAAERYGYLDRSGDWAIPPRFQWAGKFEGDFAEVELAEGGPALIDRSGRVVAHVRGHLYTVRDRGGNIYYLDREWGGEKERITAVYDGKGQLLPDHPLAGREVAIYGCAATTVEDQVIGNSIVRNRLMTIWDYDGTALAVIEGAQGLSLQSCENGRATLYGWTGTGGTYGVYDLAAGAWIIPPAEYSFVWGVTDGTDTVYAARTKDGDGWHILRSDGAPIAHADVFDNFTQGLLQCQRGNSAVWLDLNGTEVFRWPLLGDDD